MCFAIYTVPYIWTFGRPMSIVQVSMIYMVIWMPCIITTYLGISWEKICHIFRKLIVIKFKRKKRYF